MGLFGKKNPPPPSYRPEMPPSVSAADLTAADRLIARWDSVLGNSDQMWDCIEAIARLGGFGGPEATLHETFAGKEFADVHERPWRWWHEAARRAQATGDDALAARIFMFVHLFAGQIRPKMRATDELTTGLGTPPAEIYRGIAAIAVASLARLEPQRLIHQSATGMVDVASALKMAEGIAGVTAPRASVSTPPIPPQRDNGSAYGGPFNSF